MKPKTFKIVVVVLVLTALAMLAVVAVLITGAVMWFNYKYRAEAQQRLDLYQQEKPYHGTAR
jgi:heme/copper-type cytochrome/quinol oxidase subunit 2